MRTIHWEHVITDAGHHLRLRGANGEPILTSEVYEHPGEVERAHQLARESFMVGTFAHAAPELVDERTNGLDLAARPLPEYRAQEGSHADHDD